MTVSYDAVKDFWDYVEFYPYSDDPKYDGVHNGGMKGLRSDAPESAIIAYAKFKEMEENLKNPVK